MRRIIQIISLVLVIIMSFSGCAFNNADKKSDTKIASESQVAVAFNPILYFDYDSIVAFNDINSAMTADMKNKTLTALSDTNWCWVNVSASNIWRRRNPFALDLWHNGSKYADSKLKAYTLTNSGATTLMCYSTKFIDINTYNDDYVEENGILMSASGDREEGLCYVADESGTLNIPAVNFTALKSVGGVNTGFMDSDDGSQRTAVIKISLNGKVLWCGEVGNYIGDNGDKVTGIQSDDLYDLPVNEGDVISFSVQLNGEKKSSVFEKDQPDADDDYDSFRLQTTDDGNYNTEENTNEVKLLSGYDSTFRVVYPKNADIETQKVAFSLRRKLENLLQSAVTVVSDDKAATKYEMLVGETNRQESAEAYSIVRGYRKNCANDYLVTYINGKVCLAGT